MAVTGDKRRASKAEKRAEKKQKTPEVEEETKEEVEVTAKVEIPEKAKAKKAKDVVDSEEEAEEEEEGEDDDDKHDDGPEIPAEEVAAEARKAKTRTKAHRFEKALAKDDEEEPRGVIYIGHLPKGFFEPQMKAFFNQFGEVTRLRLSRSKKNAASKGYGWIEFKEEEVAKVVAQTMNKYMMFSKQLVCNVVPDEKVHPSLFRNWKNKMINMAQIRRHAHRTTQNDRPNVEVCGEKLPQATDRQAARRAKSNKKIKGLLGASEIEYDLEGAADDNDIAETNAEASSSKTKGKNQKKKSQA